MTVQRIENRRLSLSGQVMIGLVLGVAVGVFFGEMVSWLKVVGDIFIKLLQITVIPYISFSLITGLGELSFDEVKRLAFKGGSILLLVWAVTLAIVVLMARGTRLLAFVHPVEPVLFVRQRHCSGDRHI